MKWSLSLTRWLIGIAFLHLPLPGLVHGGAPSDEMRATIENVLTTLQDPNLQGPANQRERRNKLKKLIYPKFDFTEMGKRSLGIHWQRRTPEEQNRFIELFTELIETSYIDAIESYNGEKVIVKSDKQDQQFAEVNSQLVSKKGDSFAVNYKLHRSEEDWKVYDVVIENVSLVNNYRSQFNRVISKTSFENLMGRMKEKSFAAPGRHRKA